MKENAFDDVPCPFDYRKELKAARDALNKKVVECARRKWEIGYRELARKFKMSPGAFYRIAKGHKPKCKPGPRTKRPEGPRLRSPF